MRREVLYLRYADSSRAKQFWQIWLIIEDACVSVAYSDLLELLPYSLSRVGSLTTSKLRRSHWKWGSCISSTCNHPTLSILTLFFSIRSCSNVVRPIFVLDPGRGPLGRVEMPFAENSWSLVSRNTSNCVVFLIFL